MPALVEGGEVSWGMDLIQRYYTSKRKPCDRFTLPLLFPTWPKWVPASHSLLPSYSLVNSIFNGRSLCHGYPFCRMNLAANPATSYT